jgi:hypothetical protein
MPGRGAITHAYPSSVLCDALEAQRVITGAAGLGDGGGGGGEEGGEGGGAAGGGLGGGGEGGKGGESGGGGSIGGIGGGGAQTAESPEKSMLRPLGHEFPMHATSNLYASEARSDAQDEMDAGTMWLWEWDIARPVASVRHLDESNARLIEDLHRLARLRCREVSWVARVVARTAPCRRIEAAGCSVDEERRGGGRLACGGAEWRGVVGIVCCPNALIALAIGPLVEVEDRDADEGGRGQLRCGIEHA